MDTRFTPPSYLLIPLLIQGPLGAVAAPLIGLGATTGAFAGTCGAIGNFFTQGCLENRNLPCKKTLYTIAVLAVSFFATAFTAMAASGLEFATVLPFACLVALGPPAIIKGINYAAENAYSLFKELFLPDFLTA